MGAAEGERERDIWTFYCLALQLSEIFFVANNRKHRLPQLGTTWRQTCDIDITKADDVRRKINSWISIYHHIGIVSKLLSMLLQKIKTSKYVQLWLSPTFVIIEKCEERTVSWQIRRSLPPPSDRFCFLEASAASVKGVWTCNNYVTLRAAAEKSTLSERELRKQNSIL